MKNCRSIITMILIVVSTIALVSCSDKAPTGIDPTLADDLQTALNIGRYSQHGIGVSAAVLLPGQDIWLGASGKSHQGVSMTADMTFGVGSVTKTYIAALTLRLAEEGILSIDDPLSMWLPDHDDIDPTISIAQMLNHTCGIFNVNENPALWDSIYAVPTRIWTLDEILDRFLSEPYFSPGEGWHYTNTGYKLLGRIIENATGSSVSAAIRDRLLDPLDLDRTFLAQEESLPPNIAHPWYDFDENGTWDDISSSFPRMGYESMTWTSGGMYSTAKDLVLWADALFQGQVLSQASLNEMLDFNYSISGEISMSGYGLGITEFSDMVGGDVEVIGHTGSVVGYIAIIAYLPEYGVSIALLENDNIYACHVDIINRLISTVAKHMADK